MEFDFNSFFGGVFVTMSFLVVACRKYPKMREMLFGKNA